MFNRYRHIQTIQEVGKELAALSRQGEVIDKNYSGITAIFKNHMLMRRIKQLRKQHKRIAPLTSVKC